MAKTLCKCGYLITESESPNPNIYYLISDIDLEQCYDVSAAEKNDLSDMSQFSDNLASCFIFVLRCPKCGRFIIFENDSNIGTSYIKED